MMQSDKYRILNDGRVIVDYGPVTMSISAKKHGQSNTDAAVLGAKKAVETLNALAKHLETAKLRINKIDVNEIDKYPNVLKSMINSVRQLCNDEFTPMAAVAGTFSDIVLHEIMENTDVDFAVVNNGGDIAFSKSDTDEIFKVGVINNISNRRITHSLNIKNNSDIHGIATSGFGGRSLTKGVASAVTVMAENSSLADAAATEIANTTYIESDKVEICLAEEIDYDTDIKGITVVRDVGNLSKEEISRSIAQGIDKAIELYNRKMIKGAIIFVQNEFDYYPKDNLYFTVCKK